MATNLYEIIPFARAFLGDLGEKRWKDDIIVKAARVATAFLKLMGYDRGHTSDLGSVSPDLTDAESALWGKAVQALLQDPEAMKAALDAVSVRTLGTAYSTEGKARLLEASTSRVITDLRMMIRSVGSSLVGTTDSLDRDELP